MRNLEHTLHRTSVYRERLHSSAEGREVTYFLRWYYEGSKVRFCLPMETLKSLWQSGPETLCVADKKSRNLSGDVRILIVDDHAAIREGLRAILNREPGIEVCGDAKNSMTALKLVREESPTLAIVDISIGDESGLDLIRRIRETDGNVQVLAWSMYDDLLYAERALGAGAMGFINKREGTRTIVEAIHAIKAGNVYLSERMKNHMIHRSVGGRTATRKTPIETLSNRELEVFRMIGSGSTTAEISKSLHISVKTVETHRQRIKRKLQLDDANKLVREATQWVLENG